MKACTTCKVEKDFSQFYKSKTYKDGYGYRCKSCDTEARKAYEARHPKIVKGSHRRANMLNKYGLTLEQYDEMWKNQKGCCVICSIKMTNITIDGDSRNKSNTACVDHCHRSGKVRGILCAVCNKGLGLFYDRVDLLEKAIKYLK